RRHRSCRRNGNRPATPFRYDHSRSVIIFADRMSFDTPEGVWATVRRPIELHPRVDDGGRAMRRWLAALIVLVVVGGVAIGSAVLFFSQVALPIKVGLLHSQSGTMEIGEKSMIQAEILALEELNANGGLLGRTLSWVVADGQSDPQVFAREARRLIETEKVSV